MLLCKLSTMMPSGCDAGLLRIPLSVDVTPGLLWERGWLRPTRKLWIKPSFHEQAVTACSEHRCWQSAGLRPIHMSPQDQTVKHSQGFTLHALPAYLQTGMWVVHTLKPSWSRCAGWQVAQDPVLLRVEELDDPYLPLPTSPS